jgi:hypothetical protein
MPGDSLKTMAASLHFMKGSYDATIQKMILDGFFDSPVTSQEIARRVSEKSGSRLRTNHVQSYLRIFLHQDILTGVKAKGVRGNFWVLASVSRNEALSLIGKSRKVREIEEELFSADLTKKLESICDQEMKELRDVFGRHGNCTAFLLRKILEKMIIVVFAKNGKELLVEDRARPGGWKGLKEMVEIAAKEKHNGIPFLTGKTANEIKGLKFLGDSAAHNPKVGVQMNEIVPQMPFMIIAYAELAALL